MTTVTNTFASLELAPHLLSILEQLDFHTPSPIQEQTIPHLLQGRDLIGQAQTGTGKTAAFALPILHKIQPQDPSTQALILAPTRELAIQVAENFSTLSKNQSLNIAILCGGQDYRSQLTQLRKGAQIVVGTPGRILDHLDRKTLNLEHLKTFILDEADEMLRMGFIEDVETILKKIPGSRQMALFSATMPSRIRQIANSYLNNPVSVEIKSATATVKSIDQRFIFTSAGQKPDSLLRILAVEEYQGVIVFVRTKSSTEEVATYLQQQGLRAQAIHGDLTQSLRERIITQFKSGTIDILVATDVAARGLDVERVTHVINYDIAQDCETYVHRIGRTGRAGRSGITILFVSPKDSRMLNMIERHTKQKIEKILVPTDQQIHKIKQEKFLKNITTRIESEKITDYKEAIDQFIQENDLSALDVAAALALQLNQDNPWKKRFKAAEHAPSESSVRSFKDHKQRKSKESSPRKPVKDFSNYTPELYRLDVGRIHGVKPGNIVGAIANEAGIQSKFITGVKIHEDHSTVCLPKGMSKEMFQGLNKAWVCGRQLKMVSLG
jgi:ATP-dependent RNA helicase DeaD